MAGEVQRLANQLDRSYRGEAWHGPAVAELLANVDANLAAARPITGVHTIWELVEHIRFWMDAAGRRVGGDPFIQPDGADWPAPPTPTAEAWQTTLDALETSHRGLLAVVQALSEEDLERQVPGKTYTNYVLLHGVAQHNLYHAGQIALVAKTLVAGR